MFWRKEESRTDPAFSLREVP